MADAVSLNQQIAELRTLREEHSLILEKSVAKGRLGERERGFRLGRLDAAIATLEWLGRNEAAVRTAVDRRGDFDPTGKAEVERAHRAAHPLPVRTGAPGDFSPVGKAEIEREERRRRLTPGTQP